MIECNLEIIEDYAFSNLKQLVGLDLTKNNFEKLERNALSQLINLKNFSMRDNRLQSIDSTYMFVHLINLKKLFKMLFMVETILLIKSILLIILFIILIVIENKYHINKKININKNSYILNKFIS